MAELVADPGLDWLAAAVVLWLGAAGWVTAVAAHLRLSEWRWFALSMALGPVAWGAMYVRLRRERARSRRRASSEAPAGTGAR